MTITLAELRVQARRRSDMESSQFVTDGELTSYINNSIAELHDVLSDAYGSEYFVTVTSSQTITNGIDRYDLPTDFYELKGVDLKLTNQEWTNVKRFNFNERNRFANSSAWEVTGTSNIRYRIVGGQIIFSPTPDVDAEYRLWYTPLPTVLQNDSDELQDFNAYSEYVVVDVAIKMLQKEESDVSVLMAQKKALEKRIRDKSQNRDAAGSDTISDIYAEADDYFFRRGV